MPEAFEDTNLCKDCPYQNTCEVDKAMAQAEEVISKALQSAEADRLFKAAWTEVLKETKVPAGVEVRFVRPWWRLVSTACPMAQRQAARIEAQERIADFAAMRERAEAFAKRRHGS
ncbi:MAG: hypothetical protein MUP14_02385 [Dehalococcoidia bacterium]|nr:hypothetical protein [Dehalococcoidia bacterium]